MSIPKNFKLLAVIFFKNFCVVFKKKIVSVFHKKFLSVFFEKNDNSYLWVFPIHRRIHHKIILILIYQTFTTFHLQFFTLSQKTQFFTLSQKTL